MRFRFASLFFIASALSLANPTSDLHAAVITTTYGDFSGSTVTYSGVTESSASGNPFECADLCDGRHDSIQPDVIYCDPQHNKFDRPCRQPDSIHDERDLRPIDS